MSICSRCQNPVDAHSSVQLMLTTSPNKGLQYPINYCIPCAVQQVRKDIPCAYLNEMGDACELYHCVQKVIGLPSESASPSDQWLLTFVPGTMYDGVPIRTGFMKWWITPTLPATIDNEGARALEYEIIIYKEIVRPLIYEKVCPNFVRYLGSSTGCKSSQLINFLVDRAPVRKGPRVMTFNQAARAKNVSVSYLLALSDGRPSINSAYNMNPVVPQLKMLQDFKFSVLINEAFTPGTQNFMDWMKYNYKYPKLVYNILFQIMVACYALGLSKTTANDLHMGNVWIEPLSEPRTYVYIINGTPYTVEIEYLALVYDFDRAYSEKFGDNPMLEDGFLCQSNNQCNETVMNKDAIKFLMYLCPHFATKQTILDIISPPNIQGDVLQFLSQEPDKLVFLMNGNNRLTADALNALNPMDVIIAKIAGMSGGIHVGVADPSNPDTYICDPSRFAPDGTLIVTRSGI